MRNIWQDLTKWRGEGKKIAMATVVKVSGSSLRPEGSKLIMTSEGSLSGSVTGGCVEGAVFEEALGVIKTGQPRLLSYGVSDEKAWEVGLSCGGAVEIFVETLDTPIWNAVEHAIDESLSQDKLAALLTTLTGTGTGRKMLVLKNGARFGSLGSDQLEEEILTKLPENWATQQPHKIELPGGETVFADFIVPAPRMVIIGASHIAIPLVSLANTLEYHTIVVDARSGFASRERFPHADELIVDWPPDVLARLQLDAATCVVCLSHDEKQDVPSLLYAINSEARYIGALGSQKTHANRVATLREEGATDEQLKRIHAPIGLKIGSRSPAEIALSIMAQIVAAAHNIDNI